MKLVNPANKRKYTVIVVGTGLAGGAAAASLGELGYNVINLCIQDSPRRAHSIAAQGGINAAKNYQNDGDSVYRLFYDTIKGGDYRAREANVYRLAQLSVNIIDQCVAQGVPFAREYGGPSRQPIIRRGAGVAHLLRSRPDRPAAAPRRLPVADAPGAGQDGPPPRETGNARSRPRQRPRPRHHREEPGHGTARAVRRRRRHPRHRRLRHRVLPLDQRGECQRDRGVACTQARGCFSPIPASRRFTRPAFP